MPEPISTTAAVAAPIAAASVTAMLLEYTGISLPPYIWALVGAALLQSYSEQECSRLRTVAQVVLSCMSGAAIALGVAEFLDIKGVYVQHLLALIGGAFAQPILQTLFTRFQGKIDAI